MMSDDFARVVAEGRVNLNLTQEQLAALAKVDRSYVTKIENGLRPGVKVAKKLAAVLGVPWTIFFEQDCADFAHRKIDEQAESA